MRIVVKAHFTDDLKIVKVINIPDEMISFEVIKKAISDMQESLERNLPISPN